MRIKVKNMVCDRCKAVLKQELGKAGIEVVQMDLGEIQFAENAQTQTERIREVLVKNGFELIEDLNNSYIADIKKYLINALNDDLHQNISKYLSGRNPNGDENIFGDRLRFEL